MKLEERPTPETDAVFMTIAVGDFIDPHKDALRFARDHCEELERERDEAREIAKKYADRYFTMSELRHNASIVALEYKSQRDRLLEALEESLALNINWADSTEPHNLEYFSEYRAVIAQARAAIAEVKGAK